MNNSEIINKKNLCDVVTPELITDLVNTVWYAEDNGWRDRKDAEEMQMKIEKIASLCDIFELRDRPPKTYKKKT